MSRYDGFRIRRVDPEGAPLFPSSERVVIWWMKRDLRVHDNEALHGAVSDAMERRASVVPLFVFDSALVGYPDFSWFHLNAITEALTDLSHRLWKRGAMTAIVVGEVDSVLSRLNPVSIWAHEETGLDASYRRDRAVRAFAASQGVPFQELPRNGTVRRLTTRDDRIKIVRDRLSATLEAAPEQVPQSPSVQRRLEALGWSTPTGPDGGAAGLLRESVEDALGTKGAAGAAVSDPRRGIGLTFSDTPPVGDHLADATLPPDELFGPGETGETGEAPERVPPGPRRPQRVDETAAHIVMSSFLSTRGRDYSGGMSSPNTAPYAASRLSVHLAWGTISLRKAFQDTEARMAELRNVASPGPWRKSLAAFQKRLYWHDHFIQRLEDEPGIEFVPINRAFSALETNGFHPHPREEYQRRRAAWLQGATGYPMVDACIRALRSTGYLPFRMRAMIVSFAIHVLRLSWRDILYPMARWMADYVPGIHVSQLQMQAALTGINTIRVYNPTKQLADHDEDALFVRRWVPELRWRSAGRIRALPDSPLLPYPAAVVDYLSESKIAKAYLYGIKGSEFGRAEAQRVLERHGSRKRTTGRR